MTLILLVFFWQKEETFVTGVSSDLSENQVFLHYEDAIMSI